MLTEATREEFYATIGNQDVAIRLHPPYPYTAIFELRNRTEVGCVVSSWVHPEYGCGNTTSNYYLETREGG